VYTDPDSTAGQYNGHTDYRAGEAVPVVIAGQLAGQVAVTDLLPGDP
jgi:hypothetical protein